MRTSGRVRGLSVGLVLVGLLVGFGVLTAGTGGSPPGARATAAASGSTRVGWSSVPLAARAPVSAALGSDGRGYRMHAGDGGFHAVSSQQRLQARFGPAGARISSGGAVVGLRLAGIGYGRSLTPVSAVAPSGAANRITYSHAGVSEWYSNGPLGIEQGFTIPRPPAHDGTGPLMLSLALSGNLRASLEHGGQQLDLDRAGRPALAYRDLTASDASGRTLTARMALSGGRLSIALDARGARYPLRIDPLVQQAELTASGGATGEVLGSAVAVSGDGSTIVAGAPGGVGAGDPTDPGAVYVFSRPAGGWSTGTQTAKLTASAGAANDNLGYSVAISNDGSTIVAGARHVNSNTGAAYVFVKPGSAWANATESADLTVNGGDVADNFGWSVAISGDGSTVVAGAPDASTDAGAGYVFIKGGAWSGTKHQDATLTASFRVNNPDPATQLGWSSAISEDGSTIVLGASGNLVNGSMGGAGSALVYTKPMSGWSGSATETAKLTASDGGNHDLLGTAVSTSSNGATVIAGTESTVNKGAVYVFLKPALGWGDETENAKLTASDGAAADDLGSSATISSDGSTIVAGAPNAKVSGDTNRGAVYIFDKPSGAWATASENTKLTASDGAANNRLGVSVASSSDATSVVAGAAAAAGTKGVAYEFGAGGSGPGPFALNVSVSPAGGGSVRSQPAGISCPSSCNKTYASGTRVTLTATPASGYKFAAWAGDCAGTTTPACTLTMSQARTVSATFSNKASTKLTLSCSYQADAGNEICQANVTGSTTAPTGQVVFQSSNGGGFPSGNSCTLDSGASCQVTVLPPTADLTAPGTVDLSATYTGDANYAPSTAKTTFGTAGVISALQASVKNSCSVFVVNPTGGSLTSIGPTLGGTFVASMTVVAADAFGLIPPAPGSSSATDVQTDAAGDNGTEDTTCVVQSSPASAADVSAHAARTTKCRSGKSAKHKRRCVPKTVVIARVKRTLKSGVRYTIRVPLTAAGRHYFKLQKAADKKYLKHHHGKHLKLPHLKIRVTITFTPSR
jgi:trimeric autotransporter adhesin